MSTLQATNLKHNASASNNIVLDSSGNATFAGTAAMASSFLRNRIINGDMRIDQRNAGASVTPASSIYTLDRWNAIISQASRFSVQRSTVAPATFTNSLLATSLAATTVGSSDFFAMAQFVEGFNGADLGWGTANAQAVTLSFRVRSSLTGTFVVAVRSGGDDAAYPATYTINAANTWETKTITIPGPTTGTFAADSGRCFGIWFALGMGSAFHATANTWGSGSALGVAGAVNVVATNGATFYLTGVQLEVGSVATPFERRHFGVELMLCQRYYWRITKTSSSTSDITGAFAMAQVNTNAGQAFIQLPVTMRSSPTFSSSAASTLQCHIQGVTNTALNSISADALTQDGGRLSFGFTYGGTNGLAGQLAARNATAFLDFSAEL